MATKEQCDQYADDVAAKFEAFTQWAIENWPHRDYPLMQSDFAESRKEIGLILGNRLREVQNGSDSRSTKDQKQYVHVNPAPWP
jgi:hypothetical protein